MDKVMGMIKALALALVVIWSLGAGVSYIADVFAKRAECIEENGLWGFFFCDPEPRHNPGNISLIDTLLWPIRLFSESETEDGEQKVEIPSLKDMIKEGYGDDHNRRHRDSFEFLISMNYSNPEKIRKLKHLYFGENPDSEEFNLIEAVERIRLAAKKGDPVAQHELYDNYSGTMFEPTIKQDKEEGLYWLFKAADQNYPDAMFSTFLHFSIKKDEDRALEWLKKLEDIGDDLPAETMVNIAIQYYPSAIKMSIVKPDFEKSVTWLFRAITKGSRDAMALWGKIKYEYEDLVSAHAWLSVALESPYEITIAEHFTELLQQIESELSPKELEKARERKSKIEKN